MPDIDRREYHAVVVIVLMHVFKCQLSGMRGGMKIDG